MPSPPLIGVPYSDPIGRGQGFRLLTPSAPVAVKRVDAAVHVESCINKCCTGQPVLLFEIDVSDGHIRKWPVPAVSSNIATRAVSFQVRLARHLIQKGQSDRSWSRLRELAYIIPPGGIPGAADPRSSGFSATMHSVVSSRLATEAAFCSALRTTLVGSMIPAFIRSSNSSVAALKPKGPLLFLILSTTT